MKVLAINSSARKDGNAAMLVEAAFSELQGDGIECELVQLGGCDIHGCRACWGCGGKNNCRFTDDGFFEIFEKMKAADGIILASPVYAGNVSANMQAILERIGVVCDMNKESQLLSRKVGAALTVARRGGALNALDTLANLFLIQDMYMVGSTYWPIAYGQMPGDVMNDDEGIATAHRLGENMRHLLLCLRQG